MDKITINLNELLLKETLGSLKNNDFTKVWTDVVMMPIYRIEYIMTTSKHTETGYDYDQALYYGLLNRIRAFLIYERRIVCEQLINLELSSIFSRIILEDNITLQYFLRHPEKLDDYRKSCFKAEICFEDRVLKNRTERKETDPALHEWEDRLLKSVNRAYATIGMTSEQIRSVKLPKPPQVLEMAREVDMEIMYTSYRLESHSAHGDWFDISRYFLEERDGKFYPRFTEDGTDIRKLNPMLFVVYKSLSEFVRTVKGHGIDVSIEKEFDGDQRIIRTLEQMHVNFLNKRSLITDLKNRMR